MGQLRIVITAADHPRVLNAGNAAVGAWFRLVAWAARHRKAGRIPHAVARHYATGAQLRRLVAVGLLVVTPEGYVLAQLPRLEWRAATPDGWSRRAVPQVYHRDGARCRYCGRTDNPLSIDHVVPRCQGGSDNADNLAVACRRCNSRKNGRTPAQAGMVLLPPHSVP
jgi:5-methylcytosine-specific restriction endonuclease McrA